VGAGEPPRAEIAAAYERLGAGPVAVRSSACAEDSETASYAGQQETYLNVVGADDVCTRVVDCWASFFSERALFYRAQKGSLEDLQMAVVVQQMLDPEKSGVVFTVDPVQRRRDRMVVEAIFGLGEAVVSGEVTPDHYVIDRAGEVKRDRLVSGGVLDAGELVELAALGRSLEERFGCPQDVEFAIADGRVYLLQSRPVTTL
jgi:pyruvate,water dikinase